MRVHRILRIGIERTIPDSIHSGADRLVPRKIDGRAIGLSDLRPLLDGPGEPLELSAAGRRRLARSRAVVEQVLADERPVYGINTGFGKLARERIDAGELAELQINLLRSHACGVGDALPHATVRIMLLLRIRALARGYSGVRPELLESMITLYNEDALPRVPSQGSVGASGDLAPLAHLALAVVGEGELFHRGRSRSARRFWRDQGLRPLVLAPKEGLALINGTQLTTALTAEATLRAQHAVDSADVVGALTLDALKGTDRAFDPRVHEVRGQVGQREVAARLRRLLKGSAIRQSHQDCDRVQDPYSLRCMPQVHGAVRDALEEVTRTVTIELDAVTDNPLVFADTGDVISGGNFHAAPVAAAADRLAAVLSDLASISERRVENLVNPDLSSLPAFLTARPGTCSGFMIPQVVAAALVSECKALAYPASVDSIPTSANKEDHVSMGPIAARKALQVVTNCERVLAIELMAAVQALDFEERYRSSRRLEAVRRVVRQRVRRVTEDRSTAEDIEVLAQMLRSGEILQVAERPASRR